MKTFKRIKSIDNKEKRSSSSSNHINPVYSFAEPSESLQKEFLFLKNRNACLEELIDFCIPSWNEQIERKNEEIASLNLALQDKDETILELRQTVFLLGGAINDNVSHTITDSGSESDLKQLEEQIIPEDEILDHISLKDTGLDLQELEEMLLNDSECSDDFSDEPFDDLSASLEDDIHDSADRQERQKEKSALQEESGESEDSAAAESSTDLDQTADGTNSIKNRPPESHTLSEKLKRQLENLPKHTVRVLLANPVCDTCGSKLELIGFDCIRHCPGIIPARFKFETILKAGYKCPNCTGKKISYEDYIRMTGNKKKRTGKSKPRKSAGRKVKSAGPAEETENNVQNADPAQTRQQNIPCPDLNSLPVQVQNAPATAPSAGEKEGEDQNRLSFEDSAGIENTQNQNSSSSEKTVNDEGGIREDFEGSETGSSKKTVQPADIFAPDENGMVPEPGSHIIKTPTPPNVVCGSRLASKSLVMELIIMKYVLCVPYYSVEGWCSEMGFDLQRCRMSGWVNHFSSHILLWLTNYRQESLMNKSHHKQLDETYYPVHRETDKDGNRKSNRSRSCGWGEVTAEYEVKQCCLMHYSNNRRMENADRLNENFTGAIILDKYDGYNGLIKKRNLPYARCWAHWLIKAKNALIDHDLAKSDPAAVELYQRLEKIIDLDKKVRVLPFEERFQARIDLQAQPVYELFEWCEEILSSKNMPSLPKMVKNAINYGASDPEGFFYFLTDPWMPMNNLHMERQFRIVAKQRRVSFFADSPKGGEAVFTIYSVVDTVRLNRMSAVWYFREIVPELIDLNLPDWQSASKEMRESFYDELERLSPWSPYVQQRWQADSCKGDENTIETIYV